MEKQNKQEKYQRLEAQVKNLVEGEKNIVGILANVSAALKEEMDYFWVGFYLVDNGELVLGPFQGSVACYRIGFGKGVCGTSWKRGETLVVKDVEAFPGHIACSSLSRSEVVVPVFDDEGKVGAVLDIDSTELAAFDETDKEYLERIVKLIRF
ncbi:MAG: GAF domain-containing protein [Prevotellaceae bacterium]|nr:GAF domain-containing protein [Prevotella sp.]MDD7257980.1 GAF domain-containing protein [Prevotellaceae bacterium]MDY6131464.1 GAF domain-containing protein [Prevotella sp.]